MLSLAESGAASDGDRVKAYKILGDWAGMGAGPVKAGAETVRNVRKLAEMVQAAQGSKPVTATIEPN